MCKEMILAVLIISIAFGTEPEFQTRIIQLSPSAYCAAVLRPVCILHMRSRLTSEFCLSRLFFWAETSRIPAGQKKDHKIQQRRHDRHPLAQSSAELGIDSHHHIDKSHPFHLDRKDEIQQHFHIWIDCRKSKEN